jgi:hypothetical protein
MARANKTTRDERRFDKPERLIDCALNGKWAYPSWLCVAKIIAAKSAVFEQLGRGYLERPLPIDYLEPRCVNYLEHSHP